MIDRTVKMHFQGGAVVPVDFDGFMFTGGDIVGMWWRVQADTQGGPWLGDDGVTYHAGDRVPACNQELPPADSPSVWAVL